MLSTYGRGLYILDDITPLEQPAYGAERRTAAAKLVRAAPGVPPRAQRPGAVQLLAAGRRRR